MGPALGVIAVVLWQTEVLLVTMVTVLLEGIAVGRSFAMFKNYNVDGNKEMIAFGMMNIAGSLTSCYRTTGPFSRSAVNYNFSHHCSATPLLWSSLPLSLPPCSDSSTTKGPSICMWKIDKFDFIICISAYIGVVFGSVEIGLVIVVALSILRVLLFVARPRTNLLGHVPKSICYRSVDQYPSAQTVPGVLILDIGA
ncbi:hypothetical protein Cgig2_014258 [Carnegiea gigantea]|nr:hypothetical protein Cgig2_014258 [Carnegiea gigantea]